MSSAYQLTPEQRELIETVSYDRQPTDPADYLIPATDDDPDDSDGGEGAKVVRAAIASEHSLSRRSGDVIERLKSAGYSDAEIIARLGQKPRHEHADL